MSAVRLRSVELERLLIDPPDLVVVDLPCVDARQVGECWQLHDLLGVPVIVLAEGASSEQVVAHLRRGADDVLTGDPQDGLVAARSAAVLRRYRGRRVNRPPLILRLDGDIEVDMRRRVVHRPGGTQSLSRTEFNLLVALVQAGDRPCPHSELISRVWGTEAASASHYLRLYIRYLRQKLEIDARQPRHLVNVWGSGYRLIYDSATGVPLRETQSGSAVAVPPESLPAGLAS